jgi:diadenosine tetraphosphate (Ap4A) HIT family hydrolase
MHLGRCELAMMSTKDSCPFCVALPERIVTAGAHYRSIRDGFPVSPGHTLVIPLRHVLRLDELTFEESAALWRGVLETRKRLLEELHPAGFNIGANEGEAAGQTIDHLHVHVIPRYAGDAEDPRGGVRWVLPKKAAYWVK